MWRRVGLGVWSNSVELPWSLLRFSPVPLWVSVGRTGFPSGEEV